MKPGQTEGAAAGPVPFLYLLSTMALFGAAFPSSKVVVGQVPHEVAASLRFAGGAAILILLLCLRPGGSRFTGRDLRRAGTVGLIGVAAYNSLYFWGVSLAPAIDGSVIVPVLSPVLTTVFSLATGREPSSAPRLAGLPLAVVGAAVFFVGIAHAGGGLTGTRVTGDAIFLAAAACWAAYSIASQRVLRGIDPLRATTYASGVAVPWC